MVSTTGVGGYAAVGEAQNGQPLQAGRRLVRSVQARQVRAAMAMCRFHGAGSCCAISCHMRQVASAKGAMALAGAVA